LPPVGRIAFRANQPLTLAGQVRDVVARHLPDRGVPTLTTPRDVLNNALLPQRLGAVVVGGMGIAGLFLACVGLYGLVQFTVARQRHELAVRRALGGSRREILTGVLGKGLRVVLVGVVLGLVVAAFAARALSGFLIGVSPTDPLTYGAVAGLFVLVALVASWLPAHRAASIEPSQVLRGD
ncbi:MAG: FtsX-like permease family protein, partial [Gemmatimonadetes bacterium]|nr:FtsX-like permease family protein [Gemmatimonadota bacterium]